MGAVCRAAVQYRGRMVRRGEDEGLEIQGVGLRSLRELTFLRGAIAFWLGFLAVIAVGSDGPLMGAVAVVGCGAMVVRLVAPKCRWGIWCNRHKVPVNMASAAFIGVVFSAGNGQSVLDHVVVGAVFAGVTAIAHGAWWGCRWLAVVVRQRVGKL